MSSRRQEIYDRIRQTSKDEFILEEMVRLGFWPAASGIPGDPADEIRERGELQRRLAALRSESARLHNLAALEREAHKRRLAESRRKQKETKERRLRERAERAARWREARTRDIVYLGDGVSAGLGRTESDTARLEAAGLPVVSTAAELAAAMAIPVGELRYLAFRRKVSRTSHYVRFTLAKKSGGERRISAPMPRLKARQRWILDSILVRLEPHDAAHGFRSDRPGRSIVSNALPHVGKDVVVNLDLRDFFPTVTYPRVKGLFGHMGYSEAVATILALLCTEPDIAETELDGVLYHVALGERLLPQGAPTSPAITNLLCRRLDRRLAGASQKLGFTYTRYADDLTFSGAGEARGAVGRLLRQVRWIVAREGFTVHPEKTRVLGTGRRQEVTGLVVNERPAIARDTLRRFRATLYQIEKDGPAGKRWGRATGEAGESGKGGERDVIAAVLGFASYVAMVDPQKGGELLSRARALAERHGLPPSPPRGGGRRSGPAGQESGSTAAAPAAAPVSADTKGGKKKWWKIF